MACVVGCMAEKGSPPGVAYRRVAEVEAGEGQLLVVSRSLVIARPPTCGVPPERLREIVRWADSHSPVSDAIGRAIPKTVDVEAF